jgi:predicted Zn-dependent protease
VSASRTKAHANFSAETAGELKYYPRVSKAHHSGRRDAIRRTLLQQAAQARAHGQLERAIDAYQQVLQDEPENAELRAKVAPLQAQLHQIDDAWHSYWTAARTFERQGFVGKAISLYRQASRLLPSKGISWAQIADVHIERGHTAEAVQVLYVGAQHVRSSNPFQRVSLLRRAFELAPWRPDVTLALAEQLHLAGHRGEAIDLLDGLASSRERAVRRRARWRAFKLQPRWRRLLTLLG